MSRFRSHLSSHLVDDNFVPSAQWLSDNSSQVCPDCSHAIVSLSSRCTKCRSEIPDSCFNVSIPKNRYLPKLQLNHVAQVSLGTTDAVLSSGLPEMKMSVPESKRAEKKMPAPEKQFEVEKIIDKRRTSRNKPEYLVVWKDYDGETSWEGMSSLRGCKDAIDDFERSYFPQLVPRKEMNAVNVVTRDAKDQCRLLLGPVRAAGILRHPLPLLLLHRDRVRAAGVLPHPPLPLQLHRNRVRAAGVLPHPLLLFLLLVRVAELPFQLCLTV